MAARRPPSYWKKPSGVRSPPMNGRSEGSESLVMRRAPFASVRGTIKVRTPITPAAGRAATSFWLNSEGGTTTFPPRWPHFLPSAQVDRPEPGPDLLDRLVSREGPQGGDVDL